MENTALYTYMYNTSTEITKALWCWQDNEKIWTLLRQTIGS